MIKTKKVQRDDFAAWQNDDFFTAKQNFSFNYHELEIRIVGCPHPEPEIDGKWNEEIQSGFISEFLGSEKDYKFDKKNSFICNESSTAWQLPSPVGHNLRSHLDFLSVTQRLKLFT
jgi:hypothetical protein